MARSKSAGSRSLLADTAPLRSPQFRRLWTANIVTVIGAQLTVVAVPPRSTPSVTGSSAYVGLAGLFGLVPARRVRTLGRRPSPMSSTAASC